MNLENAVETTDFLARRSRIRTQASAQEGAEKAEKRHGWRWTTPLLPLRPPVRISSSRNLHARKQHSQTLWCGLFPGLRRDKEVRLRRTAGDTALSGAYDGRLMTPTDDFTRDIADLLEGRYDRLAPNCDARGGHGAQHLIEDMIRVLRRLLVAIGRDRASARCITRIHRAGRLLVA